MPSDANLAAAHLAYHRVLGGVPEPKADAAPVPVSRRDNAGVTPVQGAQGAAEIERTLNQGDSKRR
jgi:hypothetical protein